MQKSELKSLLNKIYESVLYVFAINMKSYFYIFSFWIVLRHNEGVANLEHFHLLALILTIITNTFTVITILNVQNV